MTQLSVDQTSDGWDAASARYDEHLPELLRPYALACIRLAEVAPGHELLDVAAGSGVLTLAVAPRVARVVAIDFSPQMIELLAGHAARAGLANVAAHVMDGQALALPDASFDRVTSNFGLIFFPDRIKGFAEMHRVLRPGGRAVVSTWSVLERFEPLAMFMSALQQVVPDLPRPPQPPPLLSLADPGKLAAEMRAGGFEDVRVESSTGYFEAPSAEELWARFASGAPPVAAILSRIGPENAARVRDLGIGALRQRFGEGPVKLAAEAHYGVGVR